MGYETRDPPEAKEIPRPADGEQRRLSPAGQRAMQGQDVSTPRLDDVNLADRKGHPITVRTFPSGDQTYIRAYDRTQRVPPDHVDPGQAGFANLKIEQERSGDTRARLEDIHTTPSYRENGIGSAMLGQAEKVARRNGASEIYGPLSYESKDEAAVRQFYRDHHYSTRPGPQGGDEVYKKL